AIRAEGGSARYRALDVTKREDVEAFVNFAQSEFGKVDVVINNATNARVGLSVTIHISELEGRPVLGRGVSLLIRKRGRPRRETPKGAVAQPQRAEDTGVSPRADIANTIAIDTADTDCFVIARKLAPSSGVREFGENKAGRNEAPFRKWPAGDTRDRIQRNELEGGKECSLIWRWRSPGDTDECAGARVRASGGANALNEALRDSKGVITRHVVRVSIVQLNNPALLRRHVAVVVQGARCRRPIEIGS